MARAHRVDGQGFSNLVGVVVTIAATPMFVRATLAGMRVLPATSQSGAVLKMWWVEPQQLETLVEGPQCLNTVQDDGKRSWASQHERM